MGHVLRALCEGGWSIPWAMLAEGPAEGSLCSVPHWPGTESPPREPRARGQEGGCEDRGGGVWSTPRVSEMLDKCGFFRRSGGDSVRETEGGLRRTLGFVPRNA